ncbi:hypothetical protein FGO68_gene7815 [Halteria grandinella]|uniref:Uncharacterized protein n=1 Tax=Halteria grandinella TaxID=5974 RepID=A0A8J8P1R5_HALGN|nr:hypothetical protein FGO68_gene7815 [Halteria grandinella]
MASLEYLWLDLVGWIDALLFSNQQENSISSQIIVLDQVPVATEGQCSCIFLPLPWQELGIELEAFKDRVPLIDLHSK